ncbi:MAG: hypothetical protein ACFE7E_06145 [Candidatus Hodarchaeota archaeon]
MSNPDDSFSNSRAAREDKITEAIRLIDSAREKGVILRLIGGLAARNHCKIINFCERDYSDIDMVGLGKQAKKIVKLFKENGYEEEKDVMIATAGRRMQFYKGSPDNHVDIFMDTFEMEHDVELKKRLTIEDYTITLGDLLITKLQIYKINEKDVRDILSAIKDNPLGEEDKPGIINIKYIAELCAKNWGLYHDVMENIDKCLGLMQYYDLTPDEVKRITDRMNKLKEVIETEPKSLKWKLRAKIGEKKGWRKTVEDETRDLKERSVIEADIKKTIEERESKDR